ncbi:Aldehyde/histidinol dehydrogenase [Talaromyces proteolyticus]|uniref:Aldehyde dehydrogenase n=1 Tax=Talaromyces proteolyticus TaxID=1131652 RepID=A0AAD4PZP1_9EURO|nr:Aldehyde/histidinol dehydrogenase [Talaromyces proteolyticus]KAH8699236.1 Aldehyde/histidinol dehydrogenase [Talaromyces proteolyticus]
MAAYTSDEEVDKSYTRLRATFLSGKTKSIAWRKWQLKQVWWLVNDNKQQLLDALHTDLNKHNYESFFTECTGVLNDVLDHLEHIEVWTKPKHPEGSLVMNYLMGATLSPEPRGLVLIIGPWNFPISLILQPLVAAITAGCTVLLKPSEMARASQACLEELIPRYLDNDAIRVITGGPAETTRLLQRQYDHIFFTGSPGVGRHIALAAAKHLTPTVLELGGQGPSVVTASADIDFAAKSIVSTKYINAGQICLAVNHVLAHPSIAAKLVERMQYHLKQFDLDGSKAMTKIINRKNFDRLKSAIEASNGTVVYGGVADAEALNIRPTILTDVKATDPIMNDEIFGPICPILIATTAEAIQSINSKPHPLAIYIFSHNQKEIDEIIASTISGGVTVNDTLLHSAVPGAPFGGVGESGYGAYHGAYGFTEFSHIRIISQPGRLVRSFFSLRFPPYSKQDLNKIDIKNRLGFKRGETMADQTIRLEQALWNKGGQILRWTIVFCFVVLADKWSGSWLGLWWLTTQAGRLAKQLELSNASILSFHRRIWT